MREHDPNGRKTSDLAEHLSIVAAWILVFATGVVTAALRVAIPDAAWWPAAAAGMTWFGAAATFWAVAGTKPVARRAWALIGAAELLHGVGLALALRTATATTAIYPPGASVGLQMVAYGLSIVGVVGLARSVRFGREGAGAVGLRGD